MVRAPRWALTNYGFPCRAERDILPVVQDVARLLEELRAADRELLGVQGDLENNWRQAMRYLASSRQREGELRAEDLDGARSLREVVEIRVEETLARLAGAPSHRPEHGAHAPSVPRGPRASFSPIERTEPQARFVSGALRHLHDVREELKSVHRLRHEVRTAFDKHRARAESPSTAPLDAFEMEFSLDRVESDFMRARRMIALRVVVTVLGLIAFAVFIASRWVPNS